MFLPISDDNPNKKKPVATWLLIGACVATFIWQKGLDEPALHLATLAYGLIPADLFGTVALNPSISIVPAWITIFTSMFLHGGWMHLGGNMLYLWIFGDNVEEAVGSVKFLIFYMSCGFIAALAQTMSDTYSVVPMVGASGAVSGILGAYLVLYPLANVRVLVWIIIFVTIINVPAWIVLSLWFAGQLWSQAGASASSGVAFLAHIGGFVAGLMLIFFMRRSGVRVFNSKRTRPFDTRTNRLRVRSSKGSVPKSGS